MATNRIIRQLQEGAEGYVIAVQVRKVDAPQIVAETMQDLVDQFPGEWSGEQCDNCGCCAYTIEPDATFGNNTVPMGWVARCSGDVDLARQYAEDGAGKEQVLAVQDGCGTTYRLAWYHENQVAF
jgi:hypothetical protein